VTPEQDAAGDKYIAKGRKEFEKRNSKWRKITAEIKGSCNVQ